MLLLVGICVILLFLKVSLVFDAQLLGFASVDILHTSVISNLHITDSISTG